MLGKPVRRKEDERLITGRGLYVEDVQLPGMLHLAFVRARHAHAIVRTVNTERALKVPGVVDVITADRWPELAAILPALNGSTSLVNPYVEFAKVAPHPLFSKKVTYVGEQIAVVVAENAYAAADGVDAVEVEYDPLPAVASWDAAIKPGAPKVHNGFDNACAHLKHAVGDVEKAFRDADVVIERNLECQSLKSMAIECRAAAAQWDAATKTLNVWSTCQFHYMLRNTVARVLDMPQEQVRVIARDIGGGFGLKGLLYAEDVIAPIIAYKLNRPVRWAETRMEHMISSSHSGTQMNAVKIAAKRDGTLLGLDVKMWKDVGAYNHFEMMLEINTLNHLTTHYRVPALRCEAWTVSTNTPPGAPFRGAGRVEASFIMDRALDAIARETGLDPLEVRRKNVVTPAEMPYQNGQIYRDGVPVTYKDLDFPLLLETAVERAGYAGWRERQKAARGAEKAIGIGISSYVEAGGIGPCEGAMMRVDEAGRVWVHIGVNSQGQSHETTFAQVGAHELGAKYEDVRVLGGDTALMTFGFGTGASRVAINTGNAVAKAAGTLKKKMTAYAAQVLDCPESEVELRDSVASVVGARQNFISFGDLAARSVRDPRMAALGGPGLAATEYFYPRTVVWACGVNIAVVEVDRGTGRVKILQYVFVHDSGKPLNPLVVDGQIYGGFAQGLGIALGEETMFDGDGQVLAGTMMDYYVPRASDVPDLDLAHFAFPTDENPLGIKSVGEAGPNSPPSAIAAAVEDALGGAVQIDKLPVTMRTVLDAVRARPQ